MPNIGGHSDRCGKPGCDRDAEETYEGTNGNTVRVCGKCYYKLVTRGTSETSPLGFGIDANTSGTRITRRGAGGTLGDTEPGPDIRFG